MAKRKYTEPAPRIAPLTDIPGPEADLNVLRAHYRRVQDARATHRYDDIVVVCYWCLADDQQVPANGTKSPRKFCCQRCADAHAAYTTVAYGKVRAQTDGLDDTIRRREAAKEEEKQAADDGDDGTEATE